MISLLTLWLILVCFVVLVFSSYTILYYSLSKKPQTTFKNKIFPTITLIIPFLNEQTVIKKKIENTSKINYPKEKLKILFLNDQSTDNTVGIIKKERKNIKFDFDIINSKNPKGKPNKATALSFIFPKIKSEITIITDSDSLIKEDAVTKLVQNFQDPKIGGANGKLTILKPKGNQETYNKEKNYRFFYNFWRKGESNIDSISICNGPLMAFRTNLIKNVNLTSAVDDTELIFKVIRKGMRIVYDDEALVYEVTPIESTERTKQKMRRARGLISVYLRNLRMLGKRKFGKIVYPYALLTHVVCPYIMVLIILIYLVLVFKSPLMLLLLLGFFIPKVGSFTFSFIKTQIDMAFSPFLARGWNTAKSSREELVR